jgi:protein-tyrosine phosphatase
MPDAAPNHPDRASFFTDLHVHLLPGVDDGPATMAESLEMCRMMVAEGVRVAATSPHQSHTWPDNTADRIRRVTGELRAALADAGVPLEVHPGADIRVDSDFMARWNAGQFVSVADRGRYVLLELPDNILIPLGDLSFQLRVRKVRPILTHPERCEPLQRDWSVLREWVEQGLALQITTGSLLGEFGEKARRTGEAMIDAGLAAILASDAHGPARRKPNHRAAFELVSRRWGPDAARRLMIDNPAAAFEGKALEPVAVARPEPEPARKRGFWASLFGG